MDLNKPGVIEDALDKLQMQAGFQLPGDYRELLKEFNGGEGEIEAGNWTA